MRKISLVLVAVMLLSTSSIFANNVKDKDPAKSLSAQITQILSNNHFSAKAVDLSAQVRFTVNNQGEIVVLSVDTDNNALEAFVKGRLNYQKVQAVDLKEGKLFTVTVRIAS